VKLSDVMSHAGLSGYAEVALILFVAAFLAVVVRLYWPGRGAELDRASRLPLDDDNSTTAAPDGEER
jgi:cbb3-type cytochrome oxidase subunit 3